MIEKVKGLNSLKGKITRLSKEDLVNMRGGDGDQCNLVCTGAVNCKSMCDDGGN
ncbi:MAG: hypothetical protein QNK37_19020 [Acidobacteriota bacterium]|nr:hypothetical protein [Acidobacteriota bacterium]